MIQIAIKDATIKPIHLGNTPCRWIVRHPANDAILAYCDSEEEAKHVRDAINDLARQLRATGRQVR